MEFVEQQAVADLIALLRRTEAVLDDVRGNINTERGYCAQLEEEVQTVLNEISARLHLLEGKKNG